MHPSVRQLHLYTSPTNFPSRSALVTLARNVSPPLSGSTWIYNFKSCRTPAQSARIMDAPGIPSVLIPMYHMDWESLSPSTSAAYPMFRMASICHSPYIHNFSVFPYSHRNCFPPYLLRCSARFFSASKYGMYKYWTPFRSFFVCRQHCSFSHSSGRRFSNEYWDTV